jgi:hypothetical protein
MRIYFVESLVLRAFIFALVAITLTSNAAQAETLFEAFYRIERKGKHIGYLVVRTSTDAQGHKIVSSYARRQDEDGGLGDEAFESLKVVAKSGSGLPVSSESVRARKGERTTIKAAFDRNGGGKVSARTQFRGKSSTTTESTPPATLLSAMAPLVTDWSKLKEGYTYTYNAFLETLGRNGAEAVTYVGKKKIGAQTFRHLIYHFNDQLVETLQAESGEAFATRSWNGELVTYWVNSREKASGEFEFPTAEIVRVFNDLPAGKKNPWSTKPFNALAILKAVGKADNPDANKAGLILPRRGL